MNKYVKKTIGTSLVAGVLLSSSALVLPPDAMAAFVASRSSIVADGVVGNVGADSFTLHTSDGDSVEITVTDRTHVSNEILPGNRVRVVARNRRGEVQARLVRNNRSTGPGYGIEGDRVVVHRSEVLSKTADSITIQSSAGPVTIHVTPSTNFVRKSLPEVDVGDNAVVVGEDTGTMFVGRTIVVR